MFKVGHYWKHMDRFRKTMINNSMAICPLYLLYKDHKSWSWKKGKPPPTRPVASGSSGMNLHLSELVSQIMEPIANQWVGGLETISCEDMLSQIDALNLKNKDWKPTGIPGVLTSTFLKEGHCAVGQLPEPCECVGCKEELPRGNSDSDCQDRVQGIYTHDMDKTRFEETYHNSEEDYYGECETVNGRSGGKV